MQFAIRSNGLRLTHALRGYSERRLRGALARAARLVRRIEVDLSCSDGTLPGGERCCRVRVLLDGFGALRVEERGPNPFLAIDGVVERLERNVACRLERAGGRASSFPS